MIEIIAEKKIGNPTARIVRVVLVVPVLMMLSIFLSIYFLKDEINISIPAIFGGILLLLMLRYVSGMKHHISKITRDGGGIRVEYFEWARPEIKYFPFSSLNAEFFTSGTFRDSLTGFTLTGTDGKPVRQFSSKFFEFSGWHFEDVLEVYEKLKEMKDEA